MQDPVPSRPSCTVESKAPLRVQFLLTFFGGGGKSKKLQLYYVKKGEGSIESQQKFDFLDAIASLDSGYESKSVSHH